jgi:hypothetical protein
MAQSYLRNPSVERLPVILEELHTGLLQIPPFQRDFVWSGQQRLDLFSSVEKGLPAGSLMVWRTKRPLAHDAVVGPYRVPVNGSAAPVQYLLDGRQRLTTLYAALALAFWTREGETPEGEGKAPPDGTWAVLYHLKNQSFVFAPGDYKQLRLAEVADPLLPLAVLFDDTAYDQWREKSKLTREQTNRARSLRSAFTDYMIPVVPLATEDIGTVTLTFKRVNSGGTPMSETHMLRALAWTETFDLSRYLASAREQLRPLGWADTEDDSLLKVIAAVAGMDPTEVDLEKLAEIVRAEHSVVERAGQLVARAAQVLRETVGITRPDSLPYQQVLVFIARALHLAGAGEFSEAQQRALAGWVATVYIDERFGGAPPHMVRVEWRAFASRLQLPDAAPPRARDIKQPQAKECWRFALGWARSKGTALVLAAQQPRLASGLPIEAPSSLVYTGSDHVGMLLASGARGLPPDVVGKLHPRLEAALRSPANRVVCPAAESPALRERLLASECPPEIYQSHLLDAEAHQLLVRRDLEPFFERRRELICLAEERWVEEHGGDVQVVREQRKYSQG